MAWIVYDVVTLLILVLCVIIMFRKGFISSLIGLLTFVVSLVGAFILSQLLTLPVYNLLFSKSLEQKIASGTGGLFFNFSALLTQANLNQGGIYPALATVQTAATTVIHTVLFAILFLLLLLILRAVAKMLRGLNKVPVLGAANKILGGVLGFVMGGAVCVLMATVVAILVTATSNSIDWMNTATIDKSYLFSFFYRINILNLFW